MTRSKTRRNSKRRNLRKRRGTRRRGTRRHHRRQTRRQYGGLVGMTISVNTNPNDINEEESQLAKQMRIIN